MSTLYRTKDGETLDFICWRYYKSAPSLAQAALVAQPQAAALMQQLEENSMLDYFTQQGDNTQLLGIVEAVLNANPGLCDRDVLLPEGVEINLPDVHNDAGTEKLIQLWDEV